MIVKGNVCALLPRSSWVLLAGNMLTSKERCLLPRIRDSEDFFKDFIYLFLERGLGREKDRKRNIERLPLTYPQLGTSLATQACVLPGNQTSDLSVCKLVLHPLSHTSQGSENF